MIVVPENTIAVIPYADYWDSLHTEVFEPLRGQLKREWFVTHAYYCLPLTMGNQYGFVVKSYYDFEVTWNGGEYVKDVSIKFDNPAEYQRTLGLQQVSSHFGMGTVTVQLGFALRTPPGINLMTQNPPNYYIDGITHMCGVVESDNLRRDFTFNLKVTRPNHPIRIRKGDWIGYFIPYPRHFVDPFIMKNGRDLFTNDQIQAEQKCMEDFGQERIHLDPQKPNSNGRRYFNGEDVYGNKFPDHQKRLDELE